MDNWIDLHLPKYLHLTDSVTSLTRNLLQGNGIDFLSVSGRTKTRTSIEEKIKRKAYSDPQAQITDISGIRIIVFVENDIDRVCKLIEESFGVDKNNSSNRDEALSSDQVGYRSVHFVCDIGVQRGGLPEFKGLINLKFEFQIRTVLQHAWAEMAHDRSYKFKGELPKNLKRQLYLYAGLLELADRGFNELAREIDDYANKVSEDIKSGNLDVPINSISIREYIESAPENKSVDIEELITSINIPEKITYLRDYGLDTIRQLDAFISKHDLKGDLLQSVRDILFHDDSEKNTRKVTMEEKS
ncbi:MAG: pyrophosphokinae [Rhizobium sp.]|nr:pyrophosphokinae [Rhizobium sp.]